MENGEWLTANGYTVSFWGDENVLQLWESVHNIVVKTTKFYTLKWWIFIVCELYLNKVVIKEKTIGSVWTYNKLRSPGPLRRHGSSETFYTLGSSSKIPLLPDPDLRHQVCMLWEGLCLFTPASQHTLASWREGDQREELSHQSGLSPLGYQPLCLPHVGPGQESSRSGSGCFSSHVTPFYGALLSYLGILVPTLLQQGGSIKSSPTVLPTFLEILSPRKTKLPQELSNYANVPYLPACCILDAREAHPATGNFNHHTRSQNNIPLIVST